MKNKIILITRTVILLALFLLVNSFIFRLKAQTSASIRVMVRPLNDSILIRWAPSTYSLWNWANKTGYIIERSTLMRDGKLLSSPEKLLLSKTPLKPKPLNQWEPFSGSDDYVGIAAQAIYGGSFEVSLSKNNSLMDIVNRSTEQENRFMFSLFAADQSPITAKLSGLWFTDKKVKKGESYLYKIYLASSAQFVVDTGYMFTSVDEYLPLPKPTELKASFGDKFVFLTWNRDLIERYYNGYNIEKSIDGGKTFRQINDKPFLNPEKENGDRNPFYYYLDSLQFNNLEYKYRVYGISPFGEKGPFSDVVVGAGQNKIEDNPHIIHKEIMEGKFIKVDWDFPQNKNLTLTGFKIMRSEFDQKGYKDISGTLHAETRSFTDTLPLPTNYYKVLAFKEGDIPAISLPVLVQMPDSIPPAPPKGIMAVADTSGKVLVKWGKNSEPDIYGYRVYRGNNKNEEFSQITIAPVIDTFFIDKVNLRTLTKKVYYQIVAVDQRQNYSNFSDIYEMERPDIMPPVPPIIRFINSDPNGLMIYWNPTTSEDVVKHVIFRKDSKQKQWIVLKELSDSSAILDSTALEDTAYQYKIVAYDKSGLCSDTKQSVVGRRIKNISNKLKISFLIDRETNYIKLSWEKQYNVKQYILYRKENELNMVMYSSIDGSLNSFIDRNIHFDSKYQYGIKIIYLDGKASSLNGLIYVSF